jgi:hypothetical protein
MKEILNKLVQAMGEQAIAMGVVADQVTELKERLARQFPEMAEELKAEVLEEQAKSRSDVYELQVSLAKLREAIALVPDRKATEKRVAAGGGRKVAKAV